MMNNQLPTSTYFDYRNIRRVIDGIVYEVTAFGFKRPRGMIWKYQRVPLSTRLVATQATVDGDTVARYVANRHLRTGRQTAVPVLLEMDGRLFILNGHHRLFAAMKRGDSTVDCWVGHSREPP